MKDKYVLTTFSIILIGSMTSFKYYTVLAHKHVANKDLATVLVLMATLSIILMSLASAGIGASIERLKLEKNRGLK